MPGMTVMGGALPVAVLDRLSELLSDPKKFADHVASLKDATAAHAKAEASASAAVSKAAERHRTADARDKEAAERAAALAAREAALSAAKEDLVRERNALAADRAKAVDEAQDTAKRLQEQARALSFAQSEHKESVAALAKEVILHEAAVADWDKTARQYEADQNVRIAKAEGESAGRIARMKAEAEALRQDVSRALDEAEGLKDEYNDKLEALSRLTARRA